MCQLQTKNIENQIAELNGKPNALESYQNGNTVTEVVTDSDVSSDGQMQLKQLSDKAIPELDVVEEEKPITLTQYLKSIFVMPASMRILALTNLFCWMGHVTYCLYFTDFVGEAVFNGNPKVD